MTTFSHIPPGFRFHPTDEELVDYYLRKKVASRRIDIDVIKDVDLYKIEPWDLQEKCKIGIEEQNEWYFFSHKDKKYPTGTRTNRATIAGFWKATGRDKPIYSKNNLVGMRKTLVFYKGRAPNGQKLDWIMHEYRLETNENGPPQARWVVCRVFKKKATSTETLINHDSSSYHWYDENLPFIPQFDSTKKLTSQHSEISHLPSPYFNCKPDHELISHHHLPQDHTFLNLPHLESPKFPHFINHETLQNNQQLQIVTDWRVFDKFVASQLSQEDVSKESDFCNAGKVFEVADKEIAVAECASTSTSSEQIDLWK
ncbi:hypothetical protein IEQ34_022320 [Dendrobium chrysotoxum]|uniref:NAC domain-containing protein n=1 Tax=Dendrobium chrysotoxum TaxID=161865 RepID=A0AAV7FYQ0_DENCH|nr:hypothetical protein IEQ34_022320 [Dendrobium chrysotoxum]